MTCPIPGHQYCVYLPTGWLHLGVGEAPPPNGHTFSGTMTEEFERFHLLNPRVYEILVMLARQWVQRTGRHKLGIGALYERARWEIAIATSDPDYKLNNNWRAYYARLMMLNEPDLDELFDLRHSEADEWINGYVKKFAGP